MVVSETVVLLLQRQYLAVQIAQSAGTIHRLCRYNCGDGMSLLLPGIELQPIQSRTIIVSVWQEHS